MDTGPESYQEMQLFWYLAFENGEKIKMINQSGVQNLVDFYSNQEEADTSLVLCAIQLVKSHSRLN